MPCRTEELFATPHLDDPPEVHDGHALADLRHDAHIVRHEQHTNNPDDFMGVDRLDVRPVSAPTTGER